jgi:hypothetical protein
VTFYTGSNNIFYLELAIDKTEFVKLYDFAPHEVPDPDALIDQAQQRAAAAAAVPAPAAAAATPSSVTDDLLRSLGM